VHSGAVETPLGRFPATGFAEGRPVSVALRLTAFDVSETQDALPARILSRRFLGVVELLELAVPGLETPVRARVRCGALSDSARDISVTLRHSDVLVFERNGENA